MNFNLDEYDSNQQCMLNTCTKAKKLGRKLRKLHKKKKKTHGKKARKKLKKSIHKVEKRLGKLEKEIAYIFAVMTPAQRKWWQELILQNCPELIRALSAYLNLRAQCLPSNSSNVIPTEGRDVD